MASVATAAVTTLISNAYQTFSLGGWVLLAASLVYRFDEMLFFSISALTVAVGIVLGVDAWTIVTSTIPTFTAGNVLLTIMALSPLLFVKPLRQRVLSGVNTTVQFVGKTIRVVRICGNIFHNSIQYRAILSTAGCLTLRLPFFQSFGYLFPMLMVYGLVANFANHSIWEYLVFGCCVVGKMLRQTPAALQYAGPTILTCVVEFLQVLPVSAVGAAFASAQLEFPFAAGLYGMVPIFYSNRLLSKFTDQTLWEHAFQLVRRLLVWTLRLVWSLLLLPVTVATRIPALIQSAANGVASAWESLVHGVQCMIDAASRWANLALATLASGCSFVHRNTMRAMTFLQQLVQSISTFVTNMFESMDVAAQAGQCVPDDDDMVYNELTQTWMHIRDCSNMLEFQELEATFPPLSEEISDSRLSSPSAPSDDSPTRVRKPCGSDATEEGSSTGRKPFGPNTTDLAETDDILRGLTRKESCQQDFLQVPKSKFSAAAAASNDTTAESPNK